MLKAVAQGRGQLLGGRRPNLAVDGLWCDFTATNDLVLGGLVRSAGSTAVLTTAGAGQADDVKAQRDRTDRRCGPS